MNRSVEPALVSLIPRYNGALPPELIELANSLLALSRTKASNLKAEEEIGRTYACANIACERLKQSLNLPKIEPHPPCPPRIYNKLYTYLDGLLMIRKRGRPPKNSSTASIPTKSLPSRPTPTPAQSLAAFKTPRGRPRKRGLQLINTSQEIAPWIHPIIRGLCKGLDAPAAAPHILAGVTTILTQPSPVGSEVASQEDAKKDKIPALVAAIYFFVFTRLSGKETSGKQYMVQREEVLALMTQLRDEKEIVEKTGRKENAGQEWEGWESVGSKDVAAWLLEISSKGWLKLDWFENIEEGGGLDVKEHGVASPILGKDGTGGGSSDGMLPDSNWNENEDGDYDEDLMRMGAGTMMQDRVDYLSERKRAEYRVWKDQILLRIEQMVADGICD